MWAIVVDSQLVPWTGVVTFDDEAAANEAELMLMAAELQELSQGHPPMNIRKVETMSLEQLLKEIRE